MNLTRIQRRRRVHKLRHPTEAQPFRLDHADNLPFSSFTHPPLDAVKARRRAARKVRRATRKAQR